jgi:hypothetical protein
MLAAVWADASNDQDVRPHLLPIHAAHQEGACSTSLFNANYQDSRVVETPLVTLDRGSHPSSI